MDASLQEAAGPADGAAAQRRRWMSVLAKAEPGEIEAAWERLVEKPDYAWLRRPEAGMVMVRARAGGSGAQFNLGQMTVTRCALRLTGGAAGPDCVGLGYVQGRSKRHAELAALFDALLQDRKSVVEGKSVAVRVDLGGGRILTKKKQPQ